MAHSESDNFMRVTESQSFFDQIVGQIGGGGIALKCGLAHGLLVHRDAAHHVGVDAQRGGEGIHSIEQRFLVFLIIFVVGQWLGFHQGQQCHQMAGDAGSFAAHQFGYVRIFFLRHDRRAGAEAVGDVDEADARAHPQNQLF